MHLRFDRRKTIVCCPVVHTAGVFAVAEAMNPYLRNSTDVRATHGRRYRRAI